MREKIMRLFLDIGESPEMVKVRGIDALEGRPPGRPQPGRNRALQKKPKQASPEKHRCPQERKKTEPYEVLERLK
jgi:hypothetical protein